MSNPPSWSARVAPRQARQGRLWSMAVRRRALHALPVYFAFLFMVILPACNGAQGTAQTTRIQALEDELEQCQRRRAAQDDRISELGRQIEQLSAMPEARRQAAFPRVQRVDAAPLSGGYDDDRDGVDDGIVIYLSCHDEDGDAVKAPGMVRVRLLNLSAPAAQQVVGESTVEPEALRKLWYGRVASQHYAIRTPWADGRRRPPAAKITAVVTFTDLMTGRSFEWQGAIEPTGWASPAQEPGNASR